MCDLHFICFQALAQNSVNADEASSPRDEREPLLASPGLFGEEENNMRITVHAHRQVQAYLADCCTAKTLKRKLPIMRWLPRYRLTDGFPVLSLLLISVSFHYLDYPGHYTTH